MSDELAITLSRCTTKGYVIAPAGFGKTHLIALAVKAAGHRQLVLTHTFAGVASIKTKMNVLGVPASKYHVDTIASWSLRLCLAYPQTSGWNIEHPSSKEWEKLYVCCSKLPGKEFIRHIVRSTYSGVYVDEYQDCSDLQHSLVFELAQFMPCRILGDPLQAIFDFGGGGKPVDWDLKIFPHFDCLGKLEIPHRWNNAGASDLGAWLKTVRKKLELGQQIDLRNGVPSCVRKIYTKPEFLGTKQYSTLSSFLGHDTSVIAIHGGDQESKNKTHLLARTMAGRFSSIEEVEGKALFSFINKFEKAKTVKDGFLCALDFAKKCFTGVDKSLAASTKNGEIAKQIKTTKYPSILIAANAYLTSPSAFHLRAFFLALRACPETSPYRRDLLYRFLNVLKLLIDGEANTLIEAANLYQRDLRHTGRPILHKKLIATTLLVKGLEYDHAVVLDADSLGTKDLYVAMTRGSKSLTLICSGMGLPGK
ncbi:DNA helicase-2/ATP-dependent DNA helicase PcrA [Duganella sp. SG902]|uniref:UvrD-helicase domain-containing protein n=1 Tax=Duganella sp. SG902 TaxID=2587016 RepID=UPI00159E9E80|nr:UvrD-helicase domain-containing protein [Duganella sp. SG902]NVM76463.1 DNA helicase-2/ATP-dependent DNA helicase PcrA [Duganella sp. SG902]